MGTLGGKDSQRGRHKEEEGATELVGTHSSVRMLTGYRTGIRVVAELSPRSLRSSFSLRGARWRDCQEPNGQAGLLAVYPQHRRVEGPAHQCTVPFSSAKSPQKLLSSVLNITWRLTWRESGGERGWRQLRSSRSTSWSRLGHQPHSDGSSGFLCLCLWVGGLTSPGQKTEALGG